MGAVISKLLFQPPDPASYRDNGDIIWLSTKESVQIPAVFLPCTGSDLVIIYSHGNATDLGQMIPYLELLRSKLRINVFGYEYQGYGISTPKVKASERRCYSSIEAAVEYLKSQRNIPTENMIIFGCSLGTGPTIYVTSKGDFRYRGVILQSPFTSVVRIKLNTKKAIWGDMFSNLDRIANVSCPVFIIHGRVDEVVPFAHGQKLSSLATNKYDPLWIDYAGHNNIMEVLGVDMYIRKLKKFITFLKSDDQQPQAQQPQTQPQTQQSNSNAGSTSTAEQENNNNNTLENNETDKKPVEVTDNTD